MKEAYLLRAQMNSLLGNQELVIGDIRTYDDLVGEEPSIRAAIGSLYESAGDYENAIECYTRNSDCLSDTQDQQFQMQFMS